MKYLFLLLLLAVQGGIAQNKAQKFYITGLAHTATANDCTIPPIVAYGKDRVDALLHCCEGGGLTVWSAKEYEAFQKNTGKEFEASCKTVRDAKPSNVSSDKPKYPPMGTIPNGQICADCNSQFQPDVTTPGEKHDPEMVKKWSEITAEFNRRLEAAPHQLKNQPGDDPGIYQTPPSNLCTGACMTMMAPPMATDDPNFKHYDSPAPQPLVEKAVEKWWLMDNTSIGGPEVGTVPRTKDGKPYWYKAVCKIHPGFHVFLLPDESTGEKYCLNIPKEKQ